VEIGLQRIGHASGRIRGKPFGWKVMLGLPVEMETNVVELP